MENKTQQQQPTGLKLEKEGAFEKPQQFEKASHHQQSTGQKLEKEGVFDHEGGHNKKQVEFEHKNESTKDKMHEKKEEEKEKKHNTKGKKTGTKEDKHHSKDHENKNPKTDSHNRKEEAHGQAEEMKHITKSEIDKTSEVGKDNRKQTTKTKEAKEIQKETNEKIDSKHPTGAHLDKKGAFAHDNVHSHPHKKAPDTETERRKQGMKDIAEGEILKATSDSHNNKASHEEGKRREKQGEIQVALSSHETEEAAAKQQLKGLKHVAQGEIQKANAKTHGDKKDYKKGEKLEIQGELELQDRTEERPAGQKMKEKGAGLAHTVAGSAKEVTGKLTSNKGLEERGHKEKLVGEVKLGR